MGSDEDVGSSGKGKEKEKEDSNLSSLCSVCSSPAAAHLHYGAVSCYSCRAFFRRGQPKQIRCIFGHGQCKISRHNRTNCKLCRYNRCLEVGMKPEKVDYYLNKRKEREREKSGEEGSRTSQASPEQLPNRSPDSEETIRSQLSPRAPTISRSASVSPNPAVRSDMLEIKKETPAGYSPEYSQTSGSGWRPHYLSVWASRSQQTSVIRSHGVTIKSEDRELEDCLRLQHQILHPYTSVIKRNIEIPEDRSRHHPVLNYRQSEIPGPSDEEFHNFQYFKTDDVENELSNDIFNCSELKSEKEPQDFNDSVNFKVIIPKRRVDAEFESSDEEVVKTKEVLSIVPLKKRQRMMEIPYAIGHAINKKVNPVMPFTFEEEFKVMDYIVRIEQYQNRRFEFVESQFPRYREMCAGIIHYAASGRKIPYNYNVDQTLFRIGLDFTKRACVDIYDEMAMLNVEVRREMLNTTYPALYVVMFAIMEGNTRESTWVDQQMKTLHVTKENHSSMMPLTKALQGVRALSLKDQEKFTSPWAVSDLDEEKFYKTISYLGRLLRDDIQLQALYHMLVMLSPSNSNSNKIQHNKALVTVQSEVVTLLYRYLCTSSSNTSMNYSKTAARQSNTHHKQEETSEIMKLSEGIDDLSPADKTELLLGLIPDLQDCVDIMQNRRIIVQVDVDT